jgi:mannose-6-phosphate isomerase-like protein (cupin superfamily)
MVNGAKLPVGKKFLAHYHEDMEEIFIILSGKVRVRSGDEEVIIEKGDAIMIPPKKIHEMENLIDQDVEYIVIGIVEGTNGQTIVV